MSSTKRRATAGRQFYRLEGHGLDIGNQCLIATLRKKHKYIVPPDHKAPSLLGPVGGRPCYARGRAVQIATADYERVRKAQRRQAEYDRVAASRTHWITQIPQHSSVCW
jgi:hypothetical protein